MANAGFSAPVNPWGTISGLTPTSSEDGATSSVAEAPNSYGDTVAHDVYGEVKNPSVEFAVTDDVDLSNITLGSIKTDGNTSYMMTSVSVNTAAGTPPTVSISGVQVETDATAHRTYTLSGTIKPRAKAQDVASAFSASDSYTSITTTFSVDPYIATVKGTPVASDAAHGRIEAQVTMTDPTGAATISAGEGFTITSNVAESNPDAGYCSLSATATKFLVGTEAAA